MIRYRILPALFTAVVLTCSMSGAQTATPAVTILLANDGSQGGVPYNGLVQASDGNLYGTNQCAGYSECITATGLSPSSLGNIFQITPAGDYSVVYTFTGGSDGSIPQGLVEAPDGNLYGTATWGGSHGYGSIFRFNLATHALTPIYGFSNSTDTANPLGTVIYGDDGYLYGTTVEFASNNGFGALWRIKTDGSSFGVLWSFGVSGGSGAGAANFGTYPQDGVTKVGSGLYGTSKYGGGGQGPGVLWLVNTSSQGVVLKDFVNDNEGGFPISAPKLYSDGFLYGVTFQCTGNSQTYYGSVYKAGTQSGFTSEYATQTPSCYDGRLEFDGAGNAFFGSTASGSNSTPGGALLNYKPGATTVETVYTLPSDMSEGLQLDSQPFIDNTGRVWTEQYDDGSDTNPGSIVAFDLTPAEKSPITITATPASILANGSTTIAWKSTNSFSSNEQVCFATSTPAASGWSGLQSGTYSGGVLSDSKSVTIQTAGTYVLAITCGGQETALVTVTVTGGAVATTSTLTASPTVVAAGANVTLVDTVKKNSGSGVPTGKVTFKSGSTVLYTGSLNGSGVISLTAPTTGYPNATYPIIATYAGDSTDFASTSNTVNVSIKDATATALTINPTTLKVGASVTLTATVTASQGGTPTGSVSFMDGSVNLGSVPLSGGVGKATVSSKGYPAGTYNITAVYSGDTAQAPSTSPAVKVTLTN